MDSRFAFYRSLALSSAFAFCLMMVASYLQPSETESAASQAATATSAGQLAHVEN